MDKAITDFAKSYVDGEELARKNFIDTLAKMGMISKMKAEVVFNLYLKHKLIKIDRVNRTYSVKHGAYLDAELIQDVYASNS